MAADPIRQWNGIEIANFEDAPPEPLGIRIWAIDGSEEISIAYGDTTLKMPASELGNLIVMCGNALNYLMRPESKAELENYIVGS